ncbi:MAG TPA: (d)CMP kinase [Clostridiales bacterium]|nr:(d)CMP kinase [Clostridiales bacterium]
MKPIKIAIDGPAGAGKSTIAKQIADKLDIIYLDTGAMYRAIALKCLQNNIDLEDTEAILRLLNNTQIDVEFQNNIQSVILDGIDISDEIRTTEVSNIASYIAKIPDVRKKLASMQRKIGRDKSIIMDGRDIGTYVLPNADIKIFLTASLEERAKRRWLEYRSKGECKDLDFVKREIEQRDRSDSTRKFAPLKKADDAIVIDTTDKSIEQVVDTIMQIINSRISTS